MHPATVTKLRYEYSDILSLQFIPQKPLRYIPGQFIELFLPLPQNNRRWFSLSSAPDEPHLQITTRIPHSSIEGSFKHALTQLRTGDTIQFTEPMGDFVLPIAPTRTVVFVAFSVGITPIRSILIDAYSKKYHPRCIVHHSTHQRLFSRDLQSHTNATLHYHRPTIGVPYWYNHVLSELQTDNSTPCYVAGPERLVEELQAFLRSHHIADDRIVTDFFNGY